MCNPLPDIHPDLCASHCLPLASRTRLKLDPAVPLKRLEVQKAMGTYFDSQAMRFLFPDCERCAVRKGGECVAGCLAHRIATPRKGLNGDRSDVVRLYRNGHPTLGDERVLRERICPDLPAGRSANLPGVGFVALDPGGVLFSEPTESRPPPD